MGGFSGYKISSCRSAEECLRYPVTHSASILEAYAKLVCRSLSPRVHREDKLSRGMP